MDTLRPRIFYPRLESLRGLAALVVLLFHVVQNQPGFDPAVPAALADRQTLFYSGLEMVLNGNAAVMLFFVLSGFLMGVNIDQSQGLTVPLYARFLVRRLFRLFPVIVVAVVVGFALLGGRSGYANLGRYLLLQDVSIDVPLWTVRVEILASAVYLIAFFLLARSSGAVKLLVLLLSLAFRITGSGLERAFLLGLLVPSLGRDLMHFLGGRTAGLLLPAAVMLYPLSGLMQLFALPEPYLVLLQSAASFFVISYIVYVPAQSGGRWRNILDARWARYVGRISYSLYALHWPIVIAAGAWFPLASDTLRQWHERPSCWLRPCPCPCALLPSVPRSSNVRSTSWAIGLRRCGSLRPSSRCTDRASSRAGRPALSLFRRTRRIAMPKKHAACNADAEHVEPTLVEIEKMRVEEG
jgi:peptidoglycan/LPS O-acetylase OafA/YrhL